MLRNLKEGDRYVVNHGEGLTAVDFDDHISLAEKEGVGMTGRGGLARGRCSGMYEAEGRSCYVYIALRTKTLATLKEEVRSYRWTTEGLLVGAYATVVGYEEEDLVQNDASAKE
ncbi:hypothetical protein B296_00031501 [Ensete ventricosum]|uniref:Uncharacterized protein n=1 Tax=Ensete ventricosum TaxID=4639 RepID=A0A426YIN7_ENSVE|nr:hypothetical protein B296_00031501 [Ensete ventricosum]